MSGREYVRLIDELVRLSDEAIVNDIAQALESSAPLPGKKERMARHIALRQAARIIRSVMPP